MRKLRKLSTSRCPTDRLLPWIHKRIAFFATDVFLRLNGYKLKVDAKTAHEFLIGLLENNCCDFDKLLPWIREHAIKTHD
jgi:death-on-curing protein